VDELKVPYDTVGGQCNFLGLAVPDRNIQLKYIPNEPEVVENLAHALERAIESPVDGARFSELISSGKRLVFLIENQFRAAPADRILEVLVEKARRAGCEISIVVGNATLPPLTSKELKKKVGKDLMDSAIPIYFNEPDLPQQYRFIGITRAGTPLFVKKVVADADVVVTVSTTQPTVWGYGGSGMILPAVSSNETIELNHLLSLSPDCVPGNNDCMMELDKYEALEMAGVNMGINVVLNNAGEVIFLNAGHPVGSHREAIEFYNSIYEFSLQKKGRKKVDIAITGSKALTDDLFFHTGWAIANCEPAVRNKGIIIFATPCLGYGDLPGFARMEILKDYLPACEENRIRAVKDFYKQTVTGKKSFAWYKIYEVMTRKEVWVVTDKQNLAECQEIGIIAYDSIETAFDRAIEICGQDAQIAFIPYGRSTILKD